MNKIVNGAIVNLTEKEEADKVEQDELFELERPISEWLETMNRSDKDLPRWVEDLFDLVTGAKEVADLPELTARVSSKKALRGSKP